MNINSLPDLVLRHIFSYLTLLDQVFLHHVCPKWKSLQCSVTSTRNCLTLFIGERPDPDERYPDDARSLIATSPLKISYFDQTELDSSLDKLQESTLEFSELYENLTIHLVSIFPSISSLFIVLNKTGYDTVDQVIYLLESWSQSLATLSFYYNFYDQFSFVKRITHHQKVFKLIRFINEHCLALDCLTFDVRKTLYKHFLGDEGDLDLSCLTRLREFKFNSEDNANILFPSLKQYGNGRLERITIGNQYNDGDVMAQFAQHPQIAAKFVALPCFRLPKLRQFYSTFNSLTTLEFELFNLTLPEFTAYLAPMHSLSYLQLSINCKILSKFESTPSYEFHRLESVKTLVITFEAKSHTDFRSRHWSTIFPSLQNVRIGDFSSSCKACRLRVPPQDIMQSAIEQNKRNQCLKMLMASLKQCQQLKRIVTQDLYSNVAGGKEWTIEELN